MRNDDEIMILNIENQCYRLNYTNDHYINY